MEDPAVALKLMQHTAFQVVVSDMQMPGMSGAEFLAQARKVSPETVRVMLTGNADLKTAMAGVNEGHIFQFLLKPCEQERLIQSVTAALLQHRLQTAERELLRVQLENSDKMAAIGKLAAGLTHDLNNILSAILIQTELALRDAKRDVSSNQTLALIHEAAASAAGLTRELNGFSRCDRIGSIRDIALPDLVAAGVRLARPLLKQNIEVRVAVPPDLPALHGDAGKLKQAVMNLLLNARDAMPDGGTIEIAASRSQFSAADLKDHPGRRPGEFIRLSVRDTGSGMTPQLQQQIFQPFFTTKAAGKGTGLGLFMIQRVVSEHAGWVELESAPGRGSTFSLYLGINPDSEPKETA